jgi:arsenate reductase-like glutaredoxin family protein
MRKIILFTIPGCSACVEYEPRFMKVIASNSIQYEIVDLIKTTPEWKQMAKTFDVYAFPTTLLMNECNCKLVEGNVSEEYLVNAIKEVFL